MPGAAPVKDIVARFAADESGATAVEYALLAGLIALGTLLAVSTLGANLGRMMNNISGNL